MIQPEWYEHARFTGNFSDYSVDTNDDSFPDILTIAVDVNVISPGEYTLTGSLYDANDKKIAWSIDHRNLSSGYNKMFLNFYADEFQKNSSDEIYYLKDALLTYGNSPSGQLIPIDLIHLACNTSRYNMRESVARYIQKSTISGSGRGEVFLTVTIEKNLTPTLGNYSLDLLDLHIPPFSSGFEISFPHITKNLSGYAYEAEGIYMPGMPNNFSVSASGVKNLNIGLKKQQGSYENSSNVWTDKYTRIWISSQATANDKNEAKLESYLISPGIYQAKIFGEAAKNVSQVNLTMTLVKKVIVDGRFNLSINTTGFPSGDYSITAKALNGTFKLDELEIEGI